MRGSTSSIAVWILSGNFPYTCTHKQGRHFKDLQLKKLLQVGKSNMHLGTIAKRKKSDRSKNLIMVGNNSMMSWSAKKYTPANSKQGYPILVTKKLADIARKAKTSYNR